LLKDIGVNAIKEGDWSLPQSIIVELYDILIKPITKDSDEKNIVVNLFAFSFICRHFKNLAIENSDYITIKVLMAISVGVHKHLAKNAIRFVRKNPFDEYIKDTYRQVVEKNCFHSIQPYLLRDAEAIIKVHIESLVYTDEELPTLNYSFDKVKNDEVKIRASDLLRDYWFYITRELPDIFFDTLKHAIEIGNKNVFGYFNFHLHSFLSIIYDSKNLTDYQKEDAFSDYFSRAQMICDHAMKYGIYENIEIVSTLQIEMWLVENRKRAFVCLNYFLNLLLKLNELNQLSTYYINELFFIARRLSDVKMDIEIKVNAIRIILETGFAIYKQNNSTEIIKSEIIHQLDWLHGYLIQENNLVILKNEFGDRITDLKNKI
jgi:hypothetical protein